MSKVISYLSSGYYLFEGETLINGNNNLYDTGNFLIKDNMILLGINKLIKKSRNLQYFKSIQRVLLFPDTHPDKKTLIFNYEVRSIKNKFQKR